MVLNKSTRLLVVAPTIFGFNPYYSGWCSTRRSPSCLAVTTVVVSILIILDGAQQGLIPQLHFCNLSSFNPYYSGWCSTSLFALPNLLFYHCFNPYYSGWCSTSIRLFNGAVYQLAGFNPYYSGWCSTSRFIL